MLSLLSRFKIKHVQNLGTRASFLRTQLRSQSTEGASSNPRSNVINKRKALGPVGWKSLALGGSMLAIMTGVVAYIRKIKLNEAEKVKIRSYGTAAIGGNFELIDTKGKVRTSDEFLGKWVLIYFGFTHCPDVCPEELDKLSLVIDNLAKSNIEVIPIFISVDPERDTPELVDKYLQDFSPKFIGLTGSKEQVDKATRAYRVYYSAGPRDKDNDYIVDHTIISYLMNPRGELVDYFGQTKEADEIELTMRLKMKDFK